MHGDDDLSDTESNGLLRGSKEPVQRRSRTSISRRILFPASISLNILMVVSSLVFWVWNKHTTQHSYEHGLVSDLGAVQSEIEVIQYHFTGGVKTDQDGHFFIDHASMNEQYAGSPTPAIDQAWFDLLSDLRGSEAKGLHGRTFMWPETDLHFTGLEVFHSLHCLNRIRQALYPEHYDVFSDPNDPNREQHISHCIDHIRQSIQCHADLTPMEWVQVGDKLILDTGTLHTCRNFTKISEWASQRISQYDSFDIVKNGSLYIVD